MSTDSTLTLSTTASPDEIKAHLLRSMPFEDKPDFKRWRCISSKTTYVQIGTESHPTALEFYRDEFGIDVNRSIHFSCHDEHYSVTADWEIQTIQATVSLLKRFPGDAVLISDTGVPKLVRRDGALRLMYTDGDIWDARSHASRLSLVDLPYTVEPLSNYRW